MLFVSKKLEMKPKSSKHKIALDLMKLHFAKSQVAMVRPHCTSALPMTTAKFKFFN